MHWLVVILLVSLLAGQLGATTLVPGITVYLHDFVVVAILAYGIFSGAIRRSMTKSRLVKPIVAFVAIGVLSLLINASSVSPDALLKGSLYLLRWVAYAGVYFALAGSLIPSLFLLRGLFLLGTGLAAAGLVQFFFYPDLRNLVYLGWDPHYYRVFSTLFDPNFAGILFVLTLIIGAQLLEKKRDIWVIGGIGVNMVALLLTYSRSSYLALIAAIGTWVVINKKWKIGLVGLLLFLVAIVYLPRPGREALSLDRFDSTVSRLANWSESAQLITQKPLLGHGFNVLPFLQSAPSFPSKAGAGIDNSFLFVGVTTGLAGLIAYVWLLWSMVRAGKRTWYLASLVAVIVHSLFVNSLFYPWVMVWMWILTAGR
ncbi:O-antigen ligase family protein [Candidatus Gottesmanbacteria bacterium]|nr:O-antigen ligase family protein [Candidatus Gottesmanbacteria bacterium]